MINYFCTAIISNSFRGYNEYLRACSTGAWLSTARLLLTAVSAGSCKSFNYAENTISLTVDSKHWNSVASVEFKYKVATIDEASVICKTAYFGADYVTPFFTWLEANRSLLATANISIPLRGPRIYPVCLILSVNVAKCTAFSKIYVPYPQSALNHSSITPMNAFTAEIKPQHIRGRMTDA